MDTLSILPIELLHEIASCDIGAYKALLSVPFFARSLTFDRILDYKIVFGYSIKITTLAIGWYRNGKIHRDDGPAVEHSDGMKFWYKNGLIHRDNGPAIEHSNGTKEWFQHGNCHRDDGPAVKLPSGLELWYKNGCLIKWSAPVR